MLTGEHKWGLALCIAATFLIGISDIENSPDEVLLTDTMRMMERKTYNQLFLLNASCTSKECHERVKSGLQQHNCTLSKDLRNIRIVESICRTTDSSITPEELGARAAAEIDGIEKHMKNSIVSNPQHENPRDHATVTPPGPGPTGRWLRYKRSSQKDRETNLDSVSRLENWDHSVDRETNLDSASRLENWEHSVSTWNLDRIDSFEGIENDGFDNMFSTKCFPKDGLGVTVYVIDTGCNANHNEIVGRTTLHSVGYSTATDDNGHGTHVAGIAAGTNSGVCKKCKIVCVKALNEQGNGAVSDVLGAMDWIVDEHRKDPSGSPAVSVMSLAAKSDGSDDNAHLRSIFKEAIESMSNAGVVPVVAAGNNEQDDACLYAPGQIEAAVTVGGTNMFDKPFLGGNLGKCVDIVAPGESIKSAWFSGTSAMKVEDGTSQAAPHVAGSIALIMAEKRVTQAEALRLLTMKSKKLKYTLAKSGGAQFENSYLRLLKEDCDEYNFQSVKQSPETTRPPTTTTRPPATTTTRPPTTTVQTTKATTTRPPTTSTRPPTTTVQTTPAPTTTSKTTQAPTTTLPPPTTSKKTLPSTTTSSTTFPPTTSGRVNAQNVIATTVARCPCYQNVFNIGNSSICPRPQSPTSAFSGEMRCDKEMCHPKWECVAPGSFIKTEHVCEQVTKQKASYVCAGDADSSETDCSCTLQVAMTTFLVPTKVSI